MELRETTRQTQAQNRRSTDPYRHEYRHRHRHNQPEYAPIPDARSRRHTDSTTEGAKLERLHSRPEDYKRLPQNGKLFEYIYFDGDDGYAQQSNELNRQRIDEHSNNRSRKSQPPSGINARKNREHQPNHEETGPLHRCDSYSKNEWIRPEDSGYDSEDELTLPPTYHHDLASKDDGIWFSHNKPGTRSPDQHEGTDTDTDEHRTNVQMHSHSHSPSRSSTSATLTQNRSQYSDRASSPESDALIAKVSDHLQAHREAYTHNDNKQLVNELLGEVVRKVADGGLDSKLIKDVVREVQHVL